MVVSLINEGNISFHRTKELIKGFSNNEMNMSADFTIKENYYKDPKTGETKVKKKTYFGYRYHLLADVNHKLPIEYTESKSSKGKREQLIKHLEILPDKLRKKLLL